jgi:hypothetical protein
MGTLSNPPPMICEEMFPCKPFQIVMVNPLLYNEYILIKMKKREREMFPFTEQIDPVFPIGSTQKKPVCVM